MKHNIKELLDSSGLIYSDFDMDLNYYVGIEFNDPVIQSVKITVDTDTFVDETDGCLKRRGIDCLTINLRGWTSHGTSLDLTNTQKIIDFAKSIEDKTEWVEILKTAEELAQQKADKEAADAKLTAYNATYQLYQAFINEKFKKGSRKGKIVKHNLPPIEGNTHQFQTESGMKTFYVNFEAIVLGTIE
jgi:hypothetical protein